jgi:hypothetical protein
MPEVNDHSDVADLNENMEIIDSALKTHDDALESVVDLSRAFYTSETSISVPLAADQKARMISCAENGSMMDATHGCVIYMANGDYAVLHKGSEITVAVAGGNLNVSSSSAVKMAVVEL